MDEKADHLLVPAYTEDGNQAKPQTWHAERVRSAVLSSAFRLLRRIPTDIKIFPESVSGGVNLYSVCGLVATGNTRSCELPGYVVRPIMVP